MLSIECVIISIVLQHIHVGWIADDPHSLRLIIFGLKNVLIFNKEEYMLTDISVRRLSFNIYERSLWGQSVSSRPRQVLQTSQFLCNKTG